MTLKPVRQTAHPSGVGDVISVEQLNGIVSFINDAGAAIEKEHVLGADGAWVHRNPQFAVASAHLRFAFGSSIESLVEWRLEWAEGFAVPPRFVIIEGTHRVPGAQWPEYHDYEQAEVRIEWELSDESEQWVDLGFGHIQRPDSVFDRWRVRQEGRRGILEISTFRQWDDGGPLLPPDDPTDPNALPDMGIIDMCSITLMIRTREK